MFVINQNVLKANIKRISKSTSNTSKLSHNAVRNTYDPGFSED